MSKHDFKNLITHINTRFCLLNNIYWKGESINKFLLSQKKKIKQKMQTKLWIVFVYKVYLKLKKVATINF